MQPTRQCESRRMESGARTKQRQRIELRSEHKETKIGPSTRDTGSPEQMRVRGDHNDKNGQGESVSSTRVQKSPAMAAKVLPRPHGHQWQAQ